MIEQTETKPETKEFFATLGSGQPGAPGYIHIYAKDEMEARELVHNYTNGRWSFMYYSLEDVHPLDRHLVTTLGE